MSDYSKVAKVGDWVRIYQDAPVYEEYYHFRGKIGKVAKVIPPNGWNDDFYYELEGFTYPTGELIGWDWDIVEVLDEFMVEVINANKDE